MHLKYVKFIEKVTFAPEHGGLEVPLTLLLNIVTLIEANVSLN